MREKHEHTPGTLSFYMDCPVCGKPFLASVCTIVAANGETAHKIQHVETRQCDHRLTIYYNGKYCDAIINRYRLNIRALAETLKIKVGSK